MLLVENMPNSDSKSNTEGWGDIDWRKVERYVFKLQTRIYNASRHGEVKKVRKLQRTLMRSWSNRVLAVRRVTQDNTGKNTAGVDGVKSLSPQARYKLVGQLRLTGKSKPTRRVWIPKPGKSEKRPLGIPTMYDRALQGVVKSALEPEWEAQFEPNSYGFRPGRSCHDAIKQIKTCLISKAKYVLDADIAQCFDRINHKELLTRLGIQGKVRRQIAAWLKSGVIDQGVFTAISEGTPQGGVISPLLANIALHGLEHQILKEFPRMAHRHKETWFHKKGSDFNPPNIIRYADDFVVLHEDKSVVQRCREMISEWLQGIGLWANYYSHSDIKSVGESSRQDNLTYLKLRRWAKRRCSTSSSGHQKYWHSKGCRNWVFSTGNDANALRLQLHQDVSCSSTNYVKVKGDKSPYDGDLVYWSSRAGRYPEMPNREAKLLRQQKGRCAHCGLTFRGGDVMEVDHIVPKSIGGKDEWKNLQLLHRHCHDQKTAVDLIEIRKKQHSDNLNKLFQLWEKVNWEWSEDIPFINSQTVRSLY